MRTFPATFATLFLAILPACDDKKAADTKPATPAVTTPSAAPSAPASASAPRPAIDRGAAQGPAAKPFAEKLKCESLLPESQRQALGMLNFKLTQATTCPECGPTCNLVLPDKPFEGVAVAYKCNVPYDKAAADKELDDTKKTLNKPQTVTMGRGVVMGEKDNGTFYSALAFDDDSDCKIAVDWMKGDRKKVEPLVKLAVQNAKQALVAEARK